MRYKYVAMKKKIGIYELTGSEDIGVAEDIWQKLTEDEKRQLVQLSESLYDVLLKGMKRVIDK